MKCTDEELEQAVRTSVSMSGVLRRLGYTKSGAVMKSVRGRIERLGYSTDHFNPLGRGKRKTPWTLEEVYSTYGAVLGGRVKDLIREDLGNVCECGQGPKWKGKPLTLQIDHINGDRKDHSRENLRLLCPNCHTQTSTFGGRNRKLNPPNHCVDCGTPITKRAIRCVSCSAVESAPRRGRKGKVQPTKIEWPDSSVLRALVWSMPCTAVGKKLGVSDNAVRKRCRKIGIELPPQGHFLKSSIRD